MKRERLLERMAFLFFLPPKVYDMPAWSTYASLYTRAKAGTYIEGHRNGLSESVHRKLH